MFITKVVSFISLDRQTFIRMSWKELSFFQFAIFPLISSPYNKKHNSGVEPQSSNVHGALNTLFDSQSNAGIMVQSNGLKTWCPEPTHFGFTPVLWYMLRVDPILHKVSHRPTKIWRSSIYMLRPMTCVFLKWIPCQNLKNYNYTISDHNRENHHVYPII